MEEEDPTGFSDFDALTDEEIKKYFDISNVHELPSLSQNDGQSTFYDQVVNDGMTSPISSSRDKIKKEESLNKVEPLIKNLDNPFDESLCLDHQETLRLSNSRDSQQLLLSLIINDSGNDSNADTEIPFNGSSEVDCEVVNDQLDFWQTSPKKLKEISGIENTKKSEHNLKRKRLERSTDLKTPPKKIPKRSLVNKNVSNVEGIKDSFLKSRSNVDSEYLLPEISSSGDLKGKLPMRTKNIDNYPIPNLPDIEDSPEKQEKSKNTYHDTGSSSIAPWKQYIPTSDEGGKYYEKSNFCKYCLTLQNRLDRHLVAHHPNEKDVKAIIDAPVGTLERRRRIEAVRLEGNEIFNKDETLNPEGKLICPRRISVKKKKKLLQEAPNSEINSDDQLLNKNEENHDILESNKNIIENAVSSDLTAEVIHEEPIKSDVKDALKVSQHPRRMVCHICRGYFASNNLRNHQRLKHGIDNDTVRQTLANSRKFMDQIHNRASKLVREQVVSKLRDDRYSIIIRYDLLIILYANKFSEKYDDVDQYSYVRAHLRLLAKLTITLKSLNKNIKELATAFDATYCETVYKAIRLVSGYDEGKKRFSIPYNAETLPLLIRKCCSILRNEYTATKNDTAQTALTGFMNVFSDEIGYQISHKAMLSRKELSRHKNTETVPESNDIEIFTKYLQLKRDVSIEAIGNGVITVTHWLNVLNCTALLIQLFNRRRAGEISKTLILDYAHAKAANPENEFFQMLPNQDKEQRSKYKRIDIQGKRIDGKGQLYISTENDECLKLILKYRRNFNVPEENKYLFALPSIPEQTIRHIKIVDIMARLSKECKENFHPIRDHLIRGTKLRKHLATFNSTQAQKNSVALVSKHLGHSQNVHKAHYKQTIDAEDVAITKLLEKASQKCNSNSSKNCAEENLDSSEDFTNADTSKCSEGSNTSKNKSESDDLPRLKKKYSAKFYSEDESSPDMFKNKVKRVKWSTEEIRAFEAGFKNELRQNNYPNSVKIRLIKEKYPVLKSRNENVIRTRFSNIYKK